MTESQSPTVPSIATRPTLASCQLLIRRVSRRAVAAGTTKRALTRSAPTTLSAAVVARAIRPSRVASKMRSCPGPTAAAPAESKPWASQRWPIRPVAARVATAAAAARAMSPPSTRSKLPNSSVSTLAPEPKTSLARITPEARQATRTSATTLSRPRSRPWPRTALPAVKAIAAPKAPSGAAKPSPSARTRPGKAAVPTAWEKKASPRRTIQVPSRPAGIARIKTSMSPRCTKGSWKGSSNWSVLLG